MTQSASHVFRRRIGLAAALWLGAATLACSAPCREGTIRINLTLLGQSAEADTLDVLVELQGIMRRGSAGHTPGIGMGSLEITFPSGYPSGNVEIMVTARQGDAVLGSGSTRGSLSAECSRMAVTVEPKTDSADLAAVAPDQASAVPDLLSADGGMLLGSCSAQGTLRCNPANHASQQHCDSTLHWRDEPCIATSPPIYACTGSRNKCVDTAWAQWSYSTSMPNPRFTTSLSANGEDVVSDAWTGLSWQLILPDMKYTWGTDAQAYCKNLNYAGYQDWRLPAPIELQSLVDYSHAPGTGPTVQSPFSGNTYADHYWTSAPYAGDSSQAWFVDFGFGGVSGYAASTPMPVRCVR